MVRLTLPNRLKSYNGSQPGSRSSSPMRGGGNSSPLVLKTSVLKGRNLAAKDRSGTSDPYLVVTLGDTKQATPSISKTLNPEWAVSFDLPILGPQCLLLQAVCWDKDRFGKDYMGELEVLVDEIFANGQTTQEPKWYTLKSRRKDSKKKGDLVSGDIQLQFSIVDVSNSDATPQQILGKLTAMMAMSPEEEKQAELDFARVDAIAASGGNDEADEDDELEDTSDELDPEAETDDLTKPEAIEKRKRKLRIKRMRKKNKARAYEFTGGSDCVGIVFLEICKVTDLPPERNATRTSFDMDPFVIASLGRRTYRTRVIRHNLNPVFEEKMVFQVLRHEQQYSMKFSVVDRDKLSGNDFVAQVNVPISTFIAEAPEADPETGLYKLREPTEPLAPTPSKSRFKIPLSRSTSAQSLNKLARPPLSTRASQNSVHQVGPPAAPTSAPDPNALSPYPSTTASELGDDSVTATIVSTEDDPDLKRYEIPLELKHKEKWSDKHSSQLQIKAKYMPYVALRQQFWRVLLKQYDADESQRISKIEMTTMLDTLGSTLRESTISSFFERYAEDNGTSDINAVELTFDQAVMCLEDQIQRGQRRATGDSIREGISRVSTTSSLSMDGNVFSGGQPLVKSPTTDTIPLNEDPTSTAIPVLQVEPKEVSKAADGLGKDDLLDDRGVEHFIEIRECPICHQPRLNKRSDSDIIMHIATCASGDWRKVNNLVMAGFVTSSQAQRKWYSKVVTKIGYGGYKLGANSANILVQDRITGQINEERMSVYVRLGIRLLYKGLGSRDMEKKRIRKLLKSLSFKQGRKFDDPASASQIEGFISFHQLDMSEVLLPGTSFKNFNEFFYRALKPGARPCSAPDNPKIVVSPADCRSVVFNQMSDATRIWVKGREFTIERLLGNTYPEDAKRYKNGALGVFRLAPQDYHRFHIPVDGIMGAPKLIDGEYYTVNPMAIRSALDVYGENIRVIVPIDSVAHGRVMVVCVGAMMVGSTVITRKAGERVKRTEELGYFKFGGSTILLLFEQGTMRFDSDLAENASGALETLIRVGMSIGHHPDEPQWTGDMPKDADDVTNEELQDAKRRIEGSLAPVDTKSHRHGLPNLAAAAAEMK